MRVTMALILYVLTALPVHALDRYVHPKVPPRHADIFELLQAALVATVPDYGPWELVATRADLTEARTLLEVEKDRLVNLAWSSTNTEREERLRAIRIPLRKGVLGFRLCIVTDRGAARLAQVNSLASLQKIRVGQGYDWGDVKVYKANGVDVLETFDFETLFRKLNRNRFDCFPLGVNEVYGLLEARQSLYPALKVDDQIVIQYPWPYYFFMSRQNERLAQRLETGLKRLIRNGTYDRIFYARFGRALKQARLSQRRVIRLSNPILPPDTLSAVPDVWLDPAKVDEQAVLRAPAHGRAAQTGLYPE